VKIVDGAERISLAKLLVVVVRGDEDDRRVRRLLATTDVCRSLQAVHAGQVDIEQDDREFLFQHQAQRILSAACRDDVQVEAFQNRPEHEQLVGQVIDKQDADPVA